MKTTTMRTMIAAAALVVAAGTASAQTYKAEIPMAFHAANQLMAPGSYDIKVSNTGTGDRIFVYNRTNNTAVAMLSTVKSDAPKQWRAAGDPKLAFECVNSVCRLGKLWNGSDPYLFAFPAPKSSGTLIAQRSEVITLTMIKAH